MLYYSARPRCLVAENRPRETSHRERVLVHLEIQSQRDPAFPDGETRLSGPVTDQAARYGLLKKVRDLGLTLVDVNMRGFTFVQVAFAPSRPHTGMPMLTPAALLVRF